jgi:alkylation response protein AidB-like acyl-CoA dehydrogenase
MGLPPSRDDIVTSHKILNDHGLAVPNWPVEWGGLARRVGRKGLDPTQHQIWLDEMQLPSVPEPLNFNTKVVGPVIAHFGSQETKKRFLPPTANPKFGRNARLAPPSGCGAAACILSPSRLEWVRGGPLAGERGVSGTPANLST